LKPLRFIVGAIALGCAVVVSVVAGARDDHAGQEATARALQALAPVHVSIPPIPGSIIGAYLRQLPGSAAPLARFESLTGAHLGVGMYYSGWNEPFQASFAAAADRMGIVPLVQIEPHHMSLTAISDGSQDSYLISYASAVRNYGRPVILSFGHEMNGHWYSWGYRHVKPAVFIAAWRHIVNVFTAQGADNVTWLWTVNVLSGSGADVSSPALWWPGNKYVTWVGIDGYYYRPSQTFTTLFGPTISAIGAITHKPILLAETGVAPMADRAAKIANLFRNVQADHLLGFVWFDADANRDWRIDNDPAALAAFRRAARTYR
jgi:mannan endo-1,4-beta-mannosidase